MGVVGYHSSPLSGHCQGGGKGGKEGRGLLSQQPNNLVIEENHFLKREVRAAS